MYTTGIVAGSFDPIQKGHVWLINQALNISNQLVIAVAVNRKKKYLFDPDERVDLVKRVLKSQLNQLDTDRIQLIFIENELLAAFASRIGAEVLVRGIRNANDFTYEHEMLEINRLIAPLLETVFFVPPHELTKVSSSTVKEMVGYPEWKTLLHGFACPLVIDALDKKFSNNP